jgi:IS6 family transposase
VIILLCVRWYLRYSLSYLDLEEIMAERGLSVDHSTIWRWGQRYAPILNQRMWRELRRSNGSSRVVLGRRLGWETIDFMLSAQRDLTAARIFLRRAFDCRPPQPTAGHQCGRRRPQIAADWQIGPAL